MKRVKRHKIKKEKLESTSQQQHEEHDLAYYIHDRVDLMHQVFSLLKYKEMKSMAPECIRNLAIGDLQELCTEELLGISSKRLLAIMDGAEPPSDTESSSPSPPPDLETISLDSISSDEELLSSSSKKKKHKHRHRNSKTKSKKKEKPKEGDAQTDENGELSRASRAGLTVLELLELQARARAIRAQLQQEQANKRLSETMAVESSHHSTDNEVEIKEEPPDVVEISSEDEKPDVEKLQKNITEKVTPSKVAETETNKKTEAQQNTQTVTKRVNDLIVTVPQAKITRRIKLNRNHVPVSLPNVPNTETRNITTVAKPVVVENVVVTRKLTTEKTNDTKAKKKKRDKKKKTVEKDGSDHDEITLQLSDSEKMDLFEDLDESRKNYERVSSSSEDTESSSSDSEEENNSQNTSTVVVPPPINTETTSIINSKTNAENTSKESSREVTHAESTSKNLAQEVTLVERINKNPSQEIILAESTSTKPTQDVLRVESPSKTPSQEKQLAESIPKHPPLEMLAEVETSSTNNKEIGYDCENNAEITENENKGISTEINEHLIGNQTHDDPNHTLNDTINTENEEGATDHTQVEPHTEMIVAKDISSEMVEKDDQNKKPSAESETVIINSTLEQSVAKNLLVTISSNETRSVMTVDKFAYKECNTSDKNNSESQLEQQECIEIRAIEDIPLLTTDTDNLSANISQKTIGLDKGSEKSLSDGELSDRQSSEVEAIDVQPEIVCISDEENPKSKLNKKKKKKDKKSKKEKKSKKSKSDFREGADQNFYRDCDELVGVINQENNRVFSSAKIKSNEDTIDLDSDEVYEIMELSDDSSCYEVEGTVLSKEPTAEEIEALSARIDEIEREEVVTDEQIHQHEQMILAKENDEQSDENVDHISWKDRYLGSNKVKRVLTTANILNALRKKNKELKKKIENSKVKEDIDTSNDDHVSKDIIVEEKIEEGSIGQYNTLQGSSKYVDPVKEQVEDENKDADASKEESEKSETRDNVTVEMKKDAKQLLKMYKRLLKHNGMKKQKDPNKKKKKKQKKKDKQDKINNIM